MDIKFTVFATGASIINNYLVYRAMETDAIGTIVASAIDPPPQTFPRNVFLANVRPVPHIVEVYSSSDGVALDTLLSSFMYDPTFATVEIRAALDLLSDRGGPYDPVDGQTFIGPIDGSVPGIPSIADWGDWWVEVRSKGGKLRPDEYTKNGSNDGFTYPDGFYSDTVFICFPPKITTVSPIVNAQDVFSGYVRVTGTATVQPSWYSKYVDLVFDGNSGVINLPAVASVPENRLLTLYNMNGNQEQITVRAATGENISWMGLNLPELYVGKTESLWLYKRTDPDTSVSYWHVANDLVGMQRVGLRIGGDTGVRETALQKNVGAFDGKPIPLAQFPRLRWYVKRLPVGMVLPIADRTAVNEGFWFYDGADLDSATVIHPPDYRGYHYRNIPGDKNNDTGRTAASQAGSLDGSHLKRHNHTNGVFTLLLQPSNPAIGHETAATFSGTGRPASWPRITTSGIIVEQGDREENTVLSAGNVPLFYL